MSSVDTVIRSVAPLHAGQLRIARLTSEPFILQCVSSCELEFKFSVIEQEAIDAGINDL